MADKVTGNKIKSIPEDALYVQGKAGISRHTLPKTCHRSQGTTHRTIAADVNLRAGHSRHDHDAQRPSDRLPTDHADIMLACQAVYRKIGTVRNIIDLMTDFAAEGLELQHPIKSQERFYREWAKRVDLQGRAHDFMKLLMRDANVVVRRKKAVVTKGVVREMSKADLLSIENVDETSVPEQSDKITTIKPKGKKREIPWGYTFLSPVTIEKIGGELGRFFGANALGMRLPRKLVNDINNPKTKVAKEFVKRLPAEVLYAAKHGSELIALDMSRIYVDYYKKDDWEDWGTPFLYGVLEDVMLKEKMRLADMAALDGVINVIRLWKLGKSDNQILPTNACVDKLIDILQHNTGGGVMDLVWDDMIDLSVEYPPTDKILGHEKYKSVNSDIVKGLGIPDALLGGTDVGTRTAEVAFVQLKTLVERLEYIRSRAIIWIENELKMVSEAMDFKNKQIPQVGFGVMSLRDEAAEKELMIKLLDRGIVSAERVSNIFGTNFMIELERMKDEQSFRENNGGVLEKANPFYRPESVVKLQTDERIRLEKSKPDGGNSSQDDNGGGDNPSGDQPRDEGNNPPGRPPNTKDSGPRDTRTSPTLSVLQTMAHDLMSALDPVIDVNYLKSKGTSTIRSLTKDDKDLLERIKRGCLFALCPGDVVTKELVFSRLDNMHSRSGQMESLFVDSVDQYIGVTQKTPTARNRQDFAAYAWAAFSKGE